MGSGTGGYLDKTVMRSLTIPTPVILIVNCSVSD